MSHDQLLIVLLALLPKEGKCTTTRELANATGVRLAEIDDVLSDEWMLGRVGYCNDADGHSGYFAIRQGDALPSEPESPQQQLAGSAS